MTDPVVCGRRSAEFRLAECPGSARCDLHCEHSEPWKRDVALAISVNDESAIVIIHLAGTLDHRTAVNVTALVAELIADGHSEFELHTSHLCVPDESGADVLLEIQRLLLGAGGRLAWSGSVANRTFSGLGRSLVSQELIWPIDSNAPAGFLRGFDGTTLC